MNNVRPFLILSFILLLSTISIGSDPVQPVRSSLNDVNLELNDINSIYSLNVLVVLMELPDDPHHPSHTVEHFENLFFSDGGLSVKRYFLNNSYGEVLLDGDVLGWYQSENNLSYYGNGTRLPPGQDSAADRLAYEARNLAINTGKNPIYYDLFVIIHSGDGQEYSGNSNDLWSHKWSLWRYNLPSVEYSMNHEYVNYETPSHELGHAIYFPDLYDLDYQHEFAGPFAMMDSGDGHFSIWNKYYSHVSRNDSPELLSDVHRLRIQNYTEDSFVTVNPIAMDQPNGTMWLEIGWNSTGFSESKYGRGWTVTVRENLDFDEFIPNHGVVIAEIQLDQRVGQTQVSPNVSPPWNVIDAHPETEENKDDAAFNLDDGGIGTYSSGSGWALQIIERYDNYSYRLRITKENNLPEVNIIQPNDSISGVKELIINTISANNSISAVEISIDNGPWQLTNTVPESSGLFSYNWDTRAEREGSHLLRARAIDSSSIPYVGYSSHIFVDVDNSNGSILVIDDDLGRSSEVPILSALDELGLRSEYEVKETSSLSVAEVSAEEMMKYTKIIWVGNPSISPISNSHINSNEFNELKKYLLNPNSTILPQVIFMSSYNIFDFSNQGTTLYSDATMIFRAGSPHNFRGPVDQLRGTNFLSGIPQFTLGSNDTLRDTRGSDGEVVTLLSDAVSILDDINPEYPGYSTKGYYVDRGDYKIVNYLFQPEMVPATILPQLLDLTFTYLSQPSNYTSSTSSNSNLDLPNLGLDTFLILSSLFIAVGVGGYLVFRRLKIKSTHSNSYWLKKNYEEI